VQQTDSGVYTCKTSNDLATASCSALLTVVDQLPASKEPSSRVLVIYDDVPAPPSQPVVVNVTATRVTLSWQPGPVTSSHDVTYVVEYFDHDQPDVRPLTSSIINIYY